ncbi:MAG: ParB/RepB/Spo0J family partition protein [Planctomycetota bacterium]|nr:ParB/RepB/Spo0J family partition protein [Planctomycetota bacterium]
MNGRKLGRGLDALIRRTEEIPAGQTPPPETTQESAVVVVQLDPALIQANRNQPRTQFDDGAIEELSRSIATDGIIQPLVVRRGSDGQYELIAGERRLRASRKLQLEQVPVIIREVEDQRMLPLALAENIQREDLNPIELARAYRALQQSFALTQEQLAEQVGKKRSSIANTLRFLELEDEIQDSLMNRRISAGHAKLLLSVSDHKERRQWHQKLLSKSWTVRDLDQALRLSKSHPSSPPAAKKVPSTGTNGAGTHVVAEEKRLALVLGTQVSVLETSAKGRGKIVIEFFSAEDYERVTRIIVGGSES